MFPHVEPQGGRERKREREGEEDIPFKVFQLQVLHLDRFISLCVCKVQSLSKRKREGGRERIFCRQATQPEKTHQ